MLKFLIPLGAFLALVVFLALGLRLNPQEVPSPFVGKPAPAFSAPVLGQPDVRRTREQMLGKVWLLNVWASWCAPCREEHPLLVAYAKQPGAPALVGLNYKDKPDAATKWLAQLGNPYVETLVDADGRIGIDYGVYGVPETFVIDQKGIVRLKHVGPLTPEAMRDRIVPLVDRLTRGG
jgi:cytochrome c biogenesis protein CcmG/thiol:disulfide interchange protein DsbE